MVVVVVWNTQKGPFHPYFYSSLNVSTLTTTGDVPVLGVATALLMTFRSCRDDTELEGAILSLQTKFGN